MRTYLIPVFTALALIAGCNSSNQTGGANQPAHPPTANLQAPAQPDNTITGSITTRDKITLTPQAKLLVKLVDVAQPQMPIAEQTIMPVNQIPASFSLTFDFGKIDQSRIYVIDTVLVDGPRRFIPALQSTVLTGGAGTHLDKPIVLNTEATPADKLKDEFNKLQNHIGGMKKIENTFMTEEASVGWDAFLDDGKVQFVREITDKGDKGRSTIKYAFKDDKPMALVDQETPPGSTNPTSTLRLGWNDAGELILNEKTGGGEASANDAKVLYGKAEKALKMAQDKAATMKKK